MVHFVPMGEFPDDTAVSLQYRLYDKEAGMDPLSANLAT